MERFATHIAFLGAGISIFAVTGTTQPVFATSILVNNQKLFPDKKRAGLYYYIPAGYQLHTDAAGKPELSLVKMRYTGSAKTGDAGEIRYANLLQFRVSSDRQQQRQIANTRDALKKMNPSAEMRILPIRKFMSLLVFAPAAPEPGNDSLNFVKGGLSEASNEDAAVSNSYWNERSITIRLSNTDAQLVDHALHTGLSIMSFSYVFYSSFEDRADLRTEVYANQKLRNEVKSLFDKELSAGNDTTRTITPVLADAFPLSADITRWPSVISEIDINERMPARYPLFDVYCYDFAQGLRADLWEKKIEIRATGVNGADIHAGYSFRDDRPEVFARSIRFPYAVRFDKPFFYRVTEIDQNGNAVSTDWKEKTEWSELLDISSPPEKIVLKTKPAGELP